MLGPEAEHHRVATHALQEGIGQELSNSKENDLPKEIIDEYKHLSREVRFRIVLNETINFTSHHANSTCSGDKNIA